MPSRSANNYTGKIISLAFPDTFVRFSDEKYVNDILQWFGLGRKGVIKAGHAALVLIENSTGNAEYYDFGRYITPSGKGRVRSAETDIELNIPFKAQLSKTGDLLNIEDFLLWLEKHPEKTHGDGRLVASVCNYIDYDKAKSYVLGLQNRGSILYSTFRKEGSNCSRIVTDTILASTDISKIRTSLLRNKLFTPSTIGNVEKSALNAPIYEVRNGVVEQYKGSAFKENMTNYFDKNIPEGMSKKLAEVQIEKAHLLTGIGSSAYFTLEDASRSNNFIITRYTQEGIIDFKGVFEARAPFDSIAPYTFVYDSNCKYCHVEQHGQKIRFDLIKSH